MYGSGGITPSSFISSLDEGEWPTSRPDRFTPGERAPGTHWNGGWLGHTFCLDGVVKRKTYHCWESKPGLPGRRYADERHAPTHSCVPYMATISAVIILLIF